MTIYHLIKREIFHRKLNFGLCLLSIIIAIGSLIGTLVLLKVYDLKTDEILRTKQQETEKQMVKLQDEIRKSMLKLGFNIVILPKDQNVSDWYANDYASKYMPEEYIAKLAESKFMTIKHLLPILRQKIKWPETKRTILIIGTLGEVTNLEEESLKPLVQPIPEGEIVLGYEIQQSLNLKVGDTVKLLDNKFIVSKCHKERGNKDDITVWLNLKDAQKILNKNGLINEILALECGCELSNLPKVRTEVNKLLADTQVIELVSKALTRAETKFNVAQKAKMSIIREKQNREKLKKEHKQFISILIPIIMLSCIIWISFLIFSNVKDRKTEIGILRAIGFSAKQILFIFLIKAIIMGIIGGIIGFVLGFVTGSYLGINLQKISSNMLLLFELKFLLLSIILAPILACIASWIPSINAIHQDPAKIIREE